MACLPCLQRKIRKQEQQIKRLTAVLEAGKRVLVELDFAKNEPVQGLRDAIAAVDKADKPKGKKG